MRCASQAWTIGLGLRRAPTLGNGLGFRSLKLRL